MEYKVLESFAGIVCGYPGEIVTITNEDVAKDLLKAGYIEPAKKSATKTRLKGVGKDEN